MSNTCRVYFNIFPNSIFCNYVNPVQQNLKDLQNEINLHNQISFFLAYLK